VELVWICEVGSRADASVCEDANQSVFMDRVVEESLHSRVVLRRCVAGCSGKRRSESNRRASRQVERGETEWPRSESVM